MHQPSKPTTFFTRLPEDIQQQASTNLAKVGLTLSGYLDLCLIKAANNDLHPINFLDTLEAQLAKYEAEHKKPEVIGNTRDLEKWIHDLDTD